MGAEPPFPTKQVALLMICRTFEPVAFTSVMPYIFSMIQNIAPEASDTQIQNYAAWSFSAYSFSQAVSSLVWGRVSDSYGRRIAILGGFIGTCLATISLAFSNSVSMVIISRVMAGALSGNIALVRTVLGEMVTGKQNQARAFSYNAISYQVGYSVGPTLGGMLANPCKYHPGLCSSGPGKLMRAFPYALPNLVIAVLIAISIIFTYLYLEETHIVVPEKETDVPSPAPSEGDPLLANDRAGTEVESQPKRKKLPAAVIYAIIAYLVMALHTIDFDQFFPMFLAASPPQQIPSSFIHFSGGLGLNPSQNGTAMSIAAVFSICTIAFVFTPVVSVLGTLRSMRLSAWLYPIAYFIVPYLVFIPRNAQGGLNVQIWTGIGIVLTLKTFAAAFTFTGSPILIQNAVADKSRLGTVNGIAQTCASAARAVGPLLMGSTATLGDKFGMGGAGWWFLTVFAALGVVQSYFLTEK